MKKIVTIDDDSDYNPEQLDLHVERDSDEKFLIVTFSLGNQIYGAKVTEVQEIINYPSITVVPRTVNFLAGILSLRGKIIPIIDLRRKLGMTAKTSITGKRVIITSFDNQIIGLIVDKVAEVIKLSELESNTAPSVVSSINEKFIYSVARYNDKIITILNMKNVTMVSPEEKEYTELSLVEKSRQNYMSFIKSKLS